jgi:hypothetical protein
MDNLVEPFLENASCPNDVKTIDVDDLTSITNAYSIPIESFDFNKFKLFE